MLLFMQITGQEEVIYQAKVTVASKGRRNGLAVKSGDIISIIRTTNCPKGKWLARSADNNCKCERGGHDGAELAADVNDAALTSPLLHFYSVNIKRWICSSFYQRHCLPGVILI